MSGLKRAWFGELGCRLGQSHSVADGANRSLRPGYYLPDRLALPVALGRGQGVQVSGYEIGAIKVPVRVAGPQVRIAICLIGDASVAGVVLCVRVAATRLTDHNPSVASLLEQRQ